MSTTTQKSKKQIQKDELQAFAQELKANGFTVLVSKKHPFEWLFFEKNGQFGSVGADYFGGFNFSTVHKPCVECGTGFAKARQSGLTIENATNCLMFAPELCTSTERRAIRKYKDVEEFINYTHNKWAEYYTL